MAYKDAYAVPAASSAGTVERTERKVVSFEIRIDADFSYDAHPADEYVLTLNGRVIKRMTAYQAQRFGIIPR